MNKYTNIGLDANITIGMEIESEGPLGIYFFDNDVIIAHELTDEKKIRRWESKLDGTLRSGIEVVSPVLTDNNEDIKNLYNVCFVLETIGQKVSKRCGGHIHIGANYLTSKEAYANLFEIWGNTEKIIYKISNEKGTIPRDSMQEYAPPISKKINDAIEKGEINLENEDDLNEFITNMQKIQVNKFSGVNLLNINNGKNTIEFRISNGTINPDVWIENARLYGRIVQISQRLAEIEKQPEKSQEDEKLLELKEWLKEEIPEHKKMEVLLELLFSKEEREVYRERYISNTRILEQTPNEENPFRQTEFRTIDFKKKHSTDEFRKIAVNERVDTTNTILIETEQSASLEGNIENDNTKYK